MFTNVLHCDACVVPVCLVSTVGNFTFLPKSYRVQDKWKQRMFSILDVGKGNFKILLFGTIRRLSSYQFSKGFMSEAKSKDISLYRTRSFVLCLFLVEVLD